MSDWKLLMDAETSREELDAIIDEHTRIAIEAVGIQLDAIALTTDERARLLKLGAEKIRALTRSCLEDLWREIQMEASVSGPVH